MTASEPAHRCAAFAKPIQKGRDMPALTARTSVPSSAASVSRSSRSRQGSTRRPARYAREPGYDAGTSSGFRRIANAILRSQPPFGFPKPFSASAVLCGLLSRIGKESGRQEMRPANTGLLMARVRFRVRYRLGARPWCRSGLAVRTPRHATPTSCRAAIP